MVGLLDGWMLLNSNDQVITALEGSPIMFPIILPSVTEHAAMNNK